MVQASETGPAPLPSAAAAAPPAEAAAEVRRLGQGIWVSGILQAAAQLKLADLIDDEPVPVDELAARLGVDPGALLRLLRAMVAHGLFADVGGRRFVHTDYSRVLRTDSPHSVVNLLLLAASEWNWVVWQNLGANVRSGRPAFVEHYGKDLYRYFAEDDAEAGAVFNRSMSEAGQWTSRPIAGILDLTGVRTVADVGGGQGGLLKAVLERSPTLRGVLIDSAEVVGQVDPALRAEPLSGRVTITAADIRTAVPAAADLYLLRQVMHIWDDETCSTILRNCAEHAPSGAHIVLIEHVLRDGPQPNSTFSTLIDLVMMLIGNGRERTGEDFAAVIHKAGLEFVGVTPTRTPFGMVEARVP